MASPAAGVDFDRNRLSQGELIAGIGGLALIIFMFFDWYGGKASAGGITVTGGGADAWQAFSFIDILLFLCAVVAVGVAVMRGLNRMPDMPYPPATLVAVVGGVAVLLILFRIIDTPSVGAAGIPAAVHFSITRKIGIFLGLISAAAMAYGGWRAMQESGATFGDLGGGAAAAAPTTPMAPTSPAAADTPGVPGGGAAGVSPGKEGPGVPHAGTSTGAPGEAGGGATPAPASDPVPGQTGAQTPPGIAGEPPSGTGTTPPGL